MKKFIAVMMAVIMLMLACVSVGAEFVSSPTPDTETEAAGGAEIIITPYSELDNADPRAETDDLKSVADELKNTDDLSTLNDEIKSGSRVREIFDITLVDEAKEEFDNTGKVTVTLPAGLTDDNYQLIQKNDDKWDVLSGHTRNADGSVTVTLTSLSPVALIVASASTGTGSGAPQTSDAFGVIIAVMAVAGAGLVIVSKRRKA